ncbi:MAG: sigma-E processing peptidase SpoIIGA [Clostridia bacterium]|nr:sigma-E processing peptidase SpoIIGA [Clostridia bacterium]
MNQTIYVDVLVIINIYINYGLLLLTCFCGKFTAERMKILLSSLFGGIYSLVILVPYVNDWLVSISRIPALLVMTLTAFGYGGKRAFIKKMLTFIFVNLLFGGAMFILWFLVCPENMYYNSGVVYFDIDAFTLVVFTICAYAVIKIIIFFTGNKVPDSCIYNVYIYISGEKFSCKAFYDSGNCLYDPFSGEAVTIVNVDILKGIISEDIFESFEKCSDRLKVKLIPVSTVSGNGLLPSFRADKMQIKGIDCDITIEKPIIAVYSEKIHGGEYGAILHSFIFENIKKENGDNHVLHT